MSNKKQKYLKNNVFTTKNIHFGFGRGEPSVRPYQYFKIFRALFKVINMFLHIFCLSLWKINLNPPFTRVFFTKKIRHYGYYCFFS